MKKICKSRNNLICRWCLICVVVICAVTAACNFVVAQHARGKMYTDLGALPHNRYGLLLGTSPKTPDGEYNSYFYSRVRCAAQLYKTRKIDYVIASGGDYTKTQQCGYDEPAAMKRALMKRGVPASRILLDYDGTSTIRSILKAKKVYKLEKMTIISQTFHNERALFMARCHGICAVAYNARESKSRDTRIKNRLRETLARVWMMVDLLFTRDLPRHPPHSNHEAPVSIKQTY